VQEAKRGSDVRNYHEAVALLKRVSKAKDVDTFVDPTWATRQEKENVAETNRLEHELKGYKNNLIKESIRVSLETRAHSGCLENRTAISNSYADGQRRPRDSLLRDR